jgi:phenylacetate-coenzyme A ligase PaaK-like adenylate-forming protein
MKPELFKDQIFNIKNEKEFEEYALQVFRYQSENIETYKEYIHYLDIDPSSVQSVSEIPFLPVEFFKSRKLITHHTQEEMIFLSSGTTGQNQSRHYVKDLHLYEQSFLKGFEYFYGDIKGYRILALLPSYQEREGSSLIYMVDELIKKSNDTNSGYFLDDHEQLKNVLLASEKNTLLIGVTYALLDFAENFSFQMKNTMVMETGGMKGRRKEMLREEVHQVLKNSFKLIHIHSEYGMTELLSQAYSKGDGIFKTPPWMKVIIREVNDPFTLTSIGKTGGINVIDLANLYSCSFIATQDLGKLYPDESFEIMGRFDNSDIRGCNLLVQ